MGIYRLIIAILIILSGCADLNAQPSDSSDTQSLINHQIWIDVYPHFCVNDKLEYYGDAGFRTIVTEKSWNRLYIRPSLRYHFNKTIEAHAGLGFFYIFIKYDVNRFEITPWQGIRINWPNVSIFSFKHLFRIEERISFLTNNWSSSFDLRFRYGLSGNITPCKNCSISKMYIPMYVEFFFPVNDEIEEFFRNRGRAGFGIGYNVSKDWQYSLLFNWQRSRSGPNDELRVSDYAYQLIIRKYWKYGNSK